MRVDRDTFIDQIKQFDMDTLLSLTVSLYDKLSQLRMSQLENERISTEVHIQFSELNGKYDTIVCENEELKKFLEKEIKKNTLKTKSIFGRKTEGFPARQDIRIFGYFPLSDGFTYPHLLLESPARKAVLLKRCG